MRDQTRNAGAVQRLWSPETFSECKYFFPGKFGDKTSNSQYITKSQCRSDIPLYGVNSMLKLQSLSNRQNPVYVGRIQSKILVTEPSRAVRKHASNYLGLLNRWVGFGSRRTRKKYRQLNILNQNLWCIVTVRVLVGFGVTWPPPPGHRRRRRHRWVSWIDLERPASSSSSS